MFTICKIYFLNVYLKIEILILNLMNTNITQFLSIWWLKNNIIIFNNSKYKLTLALFTSIMIERREINEKEERGRQERDMG